MNNINRRFLTAGLLATGILFSLTSCSNSNDYEIYGAIHGVVTDYTTGMPIDNVTIYLSPGGITKTTDANGYYQLNNLDPQQYTLIYQKQGYQPNRKTVTTVSGEDFEVNTQLIPIPE
ncbi:MAG: carboxypeptidase-like regulatory domain-containing protein [Muribaculaceae bacterium]|nr:carboxypeptidase-like regulatory domain-containing protein [Muribaculaceae bacterium]